MSVKMCVSYENDVELAWVQARLHADIAKIKVAKIQKGRYKRAYITLKSVPRNGANRQKNGENA